MKALKKYTLLEFSIQVSATQEDIADWHSLVAKTVLYHIGSSPATLLSINPNTSNIGYDIGEYRAGKYMSKRYLLTTIEEPTEQVIKSIIEDSDFYLGHSLLAKGVLKPEQYEEMITLWDKYLLHTGQEFFKMGSDGLIFYWYNPANNRVTIA